MKSTPFDYKRAIQLQKILSSKALESLEKPKPLGEVKYVAGVDAAYYHGRIVGVAVLLEYPSGILVEYSVVDKKPPIPYVPGLLAFREAPAYISAILKLSREPDVLMVDGHGLSHPRGLGIATHMGLVLDKPSIGVAKKKLYGERVTINGEDYLRAHGRIVAKIIKHRGKELYVSIGYKITLEEAVEITTKMLKPQYNLPLPTHIADQLSKKIAREKKNKIKPRKD